MKKSLLYASLLTGLCLTLGFVSLALSGCSTVGRALNIVNPRYSLRNVRPRVDIALPLSQSSIDFDFDLDVDNPNSVGLNLSSVDFNLFVNDDPIISGISNDRVFIPARGFGQAHLRARVGYENIRAMFREVTEVIQGNRAHYTVRGNAYFDTPIGPMRFPVIVHSELR
jgi:LEA14-like dessication related protein